MRTKIIQLEQSRYTDTHSYILSLVPIRIMSVLSHLSLPIPADQDFVTNDYANGCMAEILENKGLSSVLK